MTAEAMPPRKPPPPKRGNAIVVIALIACAAWGIFEFRRNLQLGDQVEAANAKATELQTQLANRDQELKSVSTRLNELTQRTLPISVIFRPSPNGSGLTTVFKNNAPSPMDIGVLLTNPSTNRRREVNLNIAANGIQSIGDAEGWVFAPGHHIQITHAQFGTVDYVVPGK